MHTIEFVIPVGGGLKVEIEYDYQPPEDWGGYGYRVPGSATIRSFIVLGYYDHPIPRGEGWMLEAHRIAGEWIETHESVVLEKIYERETCTT